MRIPKRFPVIAASLAFCLCSAFPAAAVPPSDPVPRSIRVEYPAPGAGEPWIRSETDFVAVFPVPLSALRAVLRDFSAYPSFMPNLRRTVVLSPEDGEGAALIRQEYLVEAFGRGFPSSYELALRLDDSRLPLSWTLSWTLGESDGSVGEASGAWTLEDVGVPGAPATRVTHRNRSLVKRFVPLQDRVMRQAARGTMVRYLLALRDRAAERAALVGAAPSERLALSD